jgi:preprotein translocase subunit YajC
MIISTALISTAYAQGTSGTPGASDIFIQFMPFVLIIVIMYFLVIRPQQQRVKAHQQLIANVRRGDTVVTSGGVIGKVVKVLEGDEVLLEIAEDVRVKVVKSMLADVRSKSDVVGPDSKGKSDEEKK